jgi:hypothetical protein
MRTEEIHIPKTKPAEQTLSPALLSSYPHRCMITDEAGKEAILTLAGYLLSFGKTYHLRFSEPVKDLRLVGYPNHLVRIQNEPTTTRKHKDDFRMIPIRVGLSSLWEKITHHGVYPHDLELDVVFPDDRRTTITIPVVLQMKLSLVLASLIMVAAAGYLLFEFFFGALFQWDFGAFFRVATWIVFVSAFTPLLLKAVMPLCLRIPKQLWTLYWRGAELQQQFHRRWRQETENTPENRN